MRNWYERHFLVVDLVVSAGCGAAFYAWLERFGGRAVFDLWVQGNRADLYGTLAGILGTLLGFAITVLSILLTVWPDTSLQLLRESTRSDDLWAVLKSCTRWLGASTLLTLLALIFDRDGATKPALAAITAFSVLLSIMRVLRTLWILEQVILIVTKKKS